MGTANKPIFTMVTVISSSSANSHQVETKFQTVKMMVLAVEAHLTVRKLVAASQLTVWSHQQKATANKANVAGPPFEISVFFRFTSLRTDRSKIAREEETVEPLEKISRNEQMEHFAVRKKRSEEKSFFTRDLKDALEVCEFIPNRLYFATFKSKRILKDTDDTHFFNTDDHLVYTNFFMDFGPLNLAKLYRFCRLLYGKLKLNIYQKKKIVYWTILTSNKRTNAAFLIGSFAVILLDMSPKEALSILSNTNYKYPPFNDANMGGITGLYTIRLNDCLSGVNKAFYFNLVNFADFNLNEYEIFEGANPQGEGDLSWIVPQKMIAFAGPCGERNGNWPVEVYLGYFKERNVYTVVRLNKSRYDSKRFTSHGIDHYDLIFPDGSVPPDDILNDFLEIVENSVGATAVHCKAGLGRTGCLIGIYLMKHYRMTSTEAIAWMRICRPGCVIGQQQTWLEAKQPWAWKQGDMYRERMYGSSEKVRQHKFGVCSIKGKTASIRNSTELERADKFAKIRERISKRRSSQDDNEDMNKRTQGDLLVAARNANVGKSKTRKVTHQ